MELLMNVDFEDITPLKRISNVKSVHYDRINKMFEIKYLTTYPSGSTRLSTLRKTYHDFVNKIINNKKSFDQKVLKTALLRWQRSENIINLWYKALYDFKPSMEKSDVRDPKRDGNPRIRTNIVNIRSKFRGRHQDTRVAQDYISQFPGGVIKFDTLKQFKVPVLHYMKSHQKYEYTDYVKLVSTRFLGLLRQSMGKNSKGYEYDISITDNKSSFDRGFILHMIRDKDEEPPSETITYFEKHANPGEVLKTPKPIKTPEFPPSKKKKK